MNTFSTQCIDHEHCWTVAVASAQLRAKWLFCLWICEVLSMATCFHPFSENIYHGRRVMQKIYVVWHTRTKDQAVQGPGAGELISKHGPVTRFPQQSSPAEVSKHQLKRGPDTLTPQQEHQRLTLWEQYNNWVTTPKGSCLSWEAIPPLILTA